METLECGSSHERTEVRPSVRCCGAGSRSLLHAESQPVTTAPRLLPESEDTPRVDSPRALVVRGVRCEELVARFYGGSERAFETLSDRWWSRLFGFFRRLGFSAEDAEDLAQESLVKLYLTRERQSFDTRLALEPFLLTLARHLAIAEWRRRRPERATVPLSDEDGPLACLDGTLERTGPGEEVLADLFLCIWSLPPDQQLYVMLCGKHGLGDLSHQEIARVLGKWPAQLTHLSQRAREGIRIGMAARGYR